MTVTAEMLEALRREVREVLSPYRAAHTFGVEQTVAEMAALYCPAQEDLLRAAALLHDITKELSDEEQLELLRRHGVSLREDELASPPVWHGMTAALVIPERYAAFADPVLLSAVRRHTTGGADLTLEDAILCLADYIEPGRNFADCVALRERFFGAEPAKMDEAARRRHLRDVLLIYLENTLSSLQKRGRPVCLDTLAALEALRNKSEI